ncbi:MAG: type 4a pilus biogenesis protein PilO [Candidatus Paceibacterota bacterium]|jgi:Tfp pilus assembly protein PilO
MRINSNIISVILLIASVGLYFGYLSPTYSGVSFDENLGSKSITELQGKKAEYEDAIDKTKEIEKARTGLLAKYNAITPDNVKKMAKLLPNYIDNVRLIIDVNTIASRYKMTLGNISVAAPTQTAAPAKTATGAASSAIGPAPVAGTAGTQTAAAGAASVAATTVRKYASAKLTFSVTGSYDNFIQFVEDLEHSLRIIDVTSITLKPPADSKTENYNFGLSINTYKLK